MLSGCSTEESDVIRVGTPFNNDGTTGVKIHKEITDSESIASLRELIDKEQNIEEPTDLSLEPEIYFSLDRPSESVSEIARDVWLIDDGTAILYEDGSESYSILTREQTNELLSILEH